jgi:hypothetical protein
MLIVVNEMPKKKNALRSISDTSAAFFKTEITIHDHHQHLNNQTLD